MRSCNCFRHLSKILTLAHQTQQERQQQEDTINQVTEQLNNSQMSCDKLREDITQCESQMSEKINYETMRVITNT